MVHAGPQSPKGRWIDYLEGDADGIVGRGNDIAALGRAMVASATTLEQVKNGADGQKGLAVDKLREVVGETHGLLRQAGELYEPTGPVLVAYGEALADVQPRIAAHVDTCAELWSAFSSLPGSMEPRGTDGWLQPEAGSTEAEQQAEEDAAKLQAYNAWQDEASRWDADYDTWEDAFEAAASGIGDVLEGKVEDGFWDDVDGFVAGLQTVLSWAGLVIGVLAIIIGGPLLALIGAVIGLIALGLTIYQFLRSDAGALQLGLAVLNVVPVGKLGKVATGKFAFADDVAWSATNWAKGGEQVTTFRAILATDGLGPGLGNLWRSSNPNGAGDIMVRLITGRDVAGYERLSAGVLTTGQGLAAAFDVMHGLMAVPLKYDGWISLFTGHETIKQQQPVFDILW
jgi:hypothetical protein